jgi:NitT/TauT family transport system ATP-binding protein
MNGLAALALDDVTCRFAARDGGAPYTAVANATLRVAEGEFVSVVGPTGCGKSTLLNVAAGLLAPSAGSVSVFGEQLIAANGVNRRAGYMFQADALMPWRTGIENVIAGLQFRGVPRSQAVEQGESWLRRVGLAGFGDRYPH